MYRTCPSPLLSLPQGLQVQIYQFVISNERMIHIDSRRTPYLLIASKSAPAIVTKGVIFNPEFHLDLAMSKIPREKEDRSDPQLHPGKKTTDVSKSSKSDDVLLRSTHKSMPIPKSYLCRSFCLRSFPPDFQANEASLSQDPPCPLHCEPWRRHWTEHNVQGHSLLLMCRHIYGTAMPILYSTHLFCFDKYQADTGNHAKSIRSSSSPGSLYAFSISIPLAGATLLRSINQRIDVFVPYEAFDHRALAHEENVKLSVDKLLLNKTWLTFIDGNDTKTLTGLSGLTGLRLLSLEFCIHFQGKSFLDDRLPEIVVDYIPMMRVFGRLRDLRVRKIHVTFSESSLTGRIPVDVEIRDALTARLLGPQGEVNENESQD